MRFGVVLLIALVAAPLAAADSVVYATDQVREPVRLVSVPLAGGVVRVRATQAVLDVSSDGSHTVSAEKTSLLYDGTVIAHADWPIDDARISPDRQTIAFNAVSEVHCGPSATNCATWELWIVRPDGSDLRELSPDGRYPRFSPDGRSVAFLGGFFPLNEGGTAVVQRLATGKREWFTFADDSAPAWAPDSTRIAYSSHGRVVVARRTPRRVTSVGAGYVPRFSPDGRALLVMRGTTLVALAGSRASIVAREVAATPPLWTSSGWVVYVKSNVRRDPLNAQVARVRPNGSSAKVLTHFEPTTYVDELWRRGSDVFARTTLSHYLLSRIDAVDVGDGAVRELVATPRDNLSPTVRTDGVLAYARGDNTRWGWFCVFTAGRCITTPSSVEGAREPVWSPDGTRLAFIERDASHAALWVTDADGSSRALIVEDAASIASPSWSADGRSLVVSSGRVGPVDGQPAGQPHLWIVDSASHSLRELDTRGPAITPAWSPDGRSIVFLGGTWGGPYDLDLYDVTTGAVSLIAPYGASPMGARPAWSPDSTRIAYRAADGSLHVIDRSGTGDRKLVDWTTPGSALSWSR